MNEVDNIHEELIALLLDISKKLNKAKKYYVKKRPILGGVFGNGGYSLCSFGLYGKTC